MNMLKAESENLFKSGLTTGLALVMLMGAPSMASAQTSEIVEHEDGIDEIIVTVERRSQSLQDLSLIHI